MDAHPESRPPLTARFTPGRIAIAAAAALLIWALSDVVLLVFFAALLATVLRGAAEWLAARTGARTGIMLAVVVVGLLLLLGAAGYFVGPRVADQGHDLVRRLAAQSDTLRHRFEQTSWARSLFQHASGSSQGITGHLAAPFEVVLSLSFETLAGLIVLVVTALYFAIAPELYLRGVASLVPIPYRPRLRQVMDDISHVLRLWLLGQLVDMVTVGVLSTVGLLLVGVPVPFALGILAGLLTFVPYFGAVVAAVPAVMVALSVSLTTALWTLAVFTLCHCVEGYVVAPLVQRRLVDLPPALTVLSMTAGAALFGALGVILGTPLAAAGMVAVREIYVGDVLGDSTGGEAANP